jgi:hypothetical protein
MNMRFLSIYKTAETGEMCSAEDMERMGRLVEEGMKAGWLVAVEGCLPSATGARVRRAGDDYTVIDGPFAETKEVIGGLAILEASSKEEALRLVKDFLQVAGDGECELRQIFEAAQHGGA